MKPEFARILVHTNTDDLAVGNVCLLKETEKCEITFADSKMYKSTYKHGADTWLVLLQDPRIGTFLHSNYPSASGYLGETVLPCLASALWEPPCACWTLVTSSASNSSVRARMLVKFRTYESRVGKFS